MQTSDLICKHVLIRGKVQGVGFRNAAFLEAKRMGGLQGWVRNLNSGEVEILVQGTTEKVEKFIEWCHQGPGGLARVDEVHDQEVKTEPALKEFGVRLM